jgi:hypothetical protein
MACFPVDECGWTLADKVHEVVKMLLHHLKASDPRMVSFGGCQSLDLAREILGLKLQKENPKGQRWWKLNPDKLEQRLKTAGLCPATYELLEPDLWEFALERALDMLAERKAKKHLYKANERKALREEIKVANGGMIPPTYRRIELQRVPVDHEGFATAEEVEIPDPDEIGEAIRRQHNGESDSFGGTIASQPSGSGWSEDLRRLDDLATRPNTIVVR